MAPEVTPATQPSPARQRRFASVARQDARLTPERARSHNRALVLQELYRPGNLSRADLARAVGLTRVTISDLVADLIEEGLVVELGQRADSRPGKPATLLDINRSGFSIVALDLSYDSLFRGVVTDLDGVVLVRDQLSVPGVTGDAAVDAVAQLLARLADRAPAAILGVGVGSPGIVDQGGTVLSAPNLGWSDLPLQTILAERSGLPVTVANDANAAALAERTFGGVQDDSILVRVGRGVGSGLIVGGTLVQGAHSAAGELGHVVVGTDGGELCACGKVGCLETWLAIPRLQSRLEGVADDAARAVALAAAGERLGIALAPVVGALNLAEVVLSGPLDTLDGTLLAATADTIRARTMADSHGGPTVRMTTLGRDIVVLGAAVMVLTGQLGVS
ncbi:ROK family transcriptional regulator [Demequina sp. SYSU T00039]|uniref:ROK family transcriptional regulator n=1 Tax=Demequina lignilytica TaxID=3051663 RepID=A0AAW7M9X5_9MICO|nr:MULTISPECIES: ROK family transcriptional regulator [unclassified Demequina]MDN4478203.1 ROK family transcriptional regulator [Demequina sp. SYSU T00039-1]MDN4488347.1 ROK family transcriptional regulator [Demequina sp. SYSU T00039]MDN4490106.1 ROK family transcriptional regulator [Demequina sp. SYSU T00068]